MPEYGEESECLSGRPAAPRPGPVRRLYDWTINWAGTPYAVPALFLLALAEASFFPIPPDVLLIAMALAAPKKSLRFAGVCTLGSVLGGCLGYVIGMFFFEAVGQPLLRFYGYEEQFQRLSAQFGDHGFLFIFIAALTPIPYKVFTIAAGVCHADVSFSVLVLASVIGRGLRFYGLGALFRAFGAPIRTFVDRYFNLLTILLLVLLAVGFLCIRLLTAARAPVPVAPAQPGPAVLAPPNGSSSPMLSDDARRTLLEVARRTVEAAVREQPLPEFDLKDREVCGHQGAFVTLRTGGDLRGCIGRFTADQPLWQTVQEMAVAAAREDPRFFGMPLRLAELPEVHVDISVLSPLRRIRDPLQEVELGTHGVYIKKGYRTGCFLPQVATETGWSKEEFLSQCCAGKAGLRADAWKDPDTEVYVFTAEVIEEG